jgi:membrane protein DedA with SNARE-associated domain
MWEEILKAIPVYLFSMLKFILGPIGGYSAQLNIVTTILSTVAGMMTIVVLITYFGNWLREKVFKKLFANRKKFSTSNRKFAGIWRKYGLFGVAALTPVILTPIGGTLLAVSSGSPKEKIIVYMFVSAAVWSIIFSIAIYFFGDKVHDLIESIKDPIGSLMMESVRRGEFRCLVSALFVQ